MKKILLKVMALTLVLLTLQGQVLASVNNTRSINADNAIIEFDEAEIYSSFDEINDLVAFVNENENVSYNDLKIENSNLIENVSSSAALAMNAQDGEEPPVISAFLWGCLFSWVGLIVVYLTTDSNKAFTGPAWKGCLINGGCQALIVLSNVFFGVLSSVSSY